MLIQLKSLRAIYIDVAHISLMPQKVLSNFFHVTAEILPQTCKQTLMCQVCAVPPLKSNYHTENPEARSFFNVEKWYMFHREGAADKFGHDFSPYIHHVIVS